MLQSPLDILNLFVEFPGDVIFFLLVLAFSQGALFLAFGHRSRFPFEYTTRRYVMATSGLVLVWLGVLGVVFVGQYANLDVNRFMPPLERLAYSISLLLLTWTFLSADFIRWRNRSNLLIFGATLVLALLYINTARAWLELYDEAASFNATYFAQIWATIPAIVGIAGLLLTILNIRHIVDSPLKGVFFILFVAGNGLDLLQLSEPGITGNYLGGARLAYLAGLVLVPLIIYRLAVALLENSLVEVVLAASQPTSAVSPQTYQTDGDKSDADAALLAAPASWNFAASAVPNDSRQMLNAISVMLERRDDTNTADQIVRSTIEFLRAEVAALLQVQANDYADIIAGYDDVAGQSLAGVSLNLKAQPTVLDAAKRGEQAILFPDYHAEELADLFRRMSVGAVSSVYIQPLTVEERLIAVLLVSMPYRQADLSPEEMESLRDIGFVAGHLLDWDVDAVSPGSLADVRAIEEIAAHPIVTAIDQDALLKVRGEMVNSLEPVSQRIGRLSQQIDDLKRQLQEQQNRLLEVNSSGDKGSMAERQLLRLFGEQSTLREECESGGHALLDAETMLRVLNGNSGDALAQIIREYLHKEHNLLLISRDRLRRQVNALLVSGKSAGSEGIAGIMQTISDESAQLALERDQQKRRLESIQGKLESLGVATGYSGTTHMLVQLFAERKILNDHLTDANLARKALLDDRQKLIDSGGGESAELERQLKHLNSDHEQLLEAREEMRRQQQEMKSNMEALGAENATLRAQADELGDELLARDEHQETVKQQISDLVEERDNLLKIRDQLMAKVSAAASEMGQADAEIGTEFTELQGTVDRLTQQREQLALELSDARAELATAQAARIEFAAGETAMGEASRPEKPDLITDLVDDLRTPLTSIADYTNLLLAESIGILGAAQSQVLEMISADIDRFTHVIAELEAVAQVDSSKSSVQHREIDVLRIIEDIIEERSALMAAKGLVIDLSLGNQLPPISADSASLRHIFTQLIDNASIVSPAGGQIKIDASFGRLSLPNANEEMDALEITVHDQGGGIQPDDLQRVFARRYRPDNPEIPGLGDAGVGFAVARAFARAHEGDLWVTSESDKGSRFHLALPLQLAASIKDQ